MASFRILADEQKMPSTVLIPSSTDEADEEKLLYCQLQTLNPSQKQFVLKMKILKMLIKGLKAEKGT